MSRWKAAAVCILAFAALLVESQAQAQPTADPDEVAAMRALDAFLAGFNSRDPKKFASALHFPHVQLEGGKRQSPIGGHD